MIHEGGRNNTDPKHGTVDVNRFELWVENCLVPVLGDYSKREPRSIVVFNNASVHHSECIVCLIENAGAFIVHSPLYSPDYNPIELMFNMYKMSVKRLTREYDWLDAHMLSLDCVKPNQA